MSRPIVDYKGRRRSKTIAFRVSPEEDEVINALVAASGMTKQDYITSRLECRDINVSPNVRVYRMLRDQMRSVYVELRRLRSADGIDERLIELMQVLTRVFIDLGADELGAVGDDVAQQDAAVLRMRGLAPPGGRQDFQRSTSDSLLGAFAARRAPFDRIALPPPWASKVRTAARCAPQGLRCFSDFFCRPREKAKAAKQSALRASENQRPDGARNAPSLPPLQGAAGGAAPMPQGGARGSAPTERRSP
ncbi:MAG: plasmid mobilization protein [Paratractidigestivibacter faecalis]